MTMTSTAYALVHDVRDMLSGLPRGSDDDAAFATFVSLARERAEKLGAIALTSAERMEVAVVGYFRSGKSTLVNALLGRQLLPARHEPTTLVASRIAYRASGYGARFVFIGRGELERERSELEAALRDGRPFEAFRRALVSVGALAEGDGGPSLDRERIEELREGLGLGRGLGNLPMVIETRLGTVVEVECESEQTLQHAVWPVIARSPGDVRPGDLPFEEWAMLSEVVLLGPFEGLRSLLATDVNPSCVSILDTPGFGDRPHLDRTVREALGTADVVCVNLGHHGNIGEKDDTLIRQLVSAGCVRQLVVAVAKSDLIRSSGDGSEEHLLQTKRHVRNAYGKDVPVVPVVARASFLRQLCVTGSDVTVSMADRRLLDDYRDDVDTGLDELRAEIRRTLDPQTRARHVEMILRDAAARALHRCAEEMLEVISAARRSCDLASRHWKALSGALRQLASAATEGRIDREHALRFGEVVGEYVRARGRREGVLAFPSCDYKCCGVPAVARFQFGSTLHFACDAHRSEVKSIHEAAKPPEVPESEKCVAYKCPSPRLPGKPVCAGHELSCGRV